MTVGYDLVLEAATSEQVFLLFSLSVIQPRPSAQVVYSRSKVVSASHSTEVALFVYSQGYKLLRTHAPPARELKSATLGAGQPYMV